MHQQLISIICWLKSNYLHHCYGQLADMIARHYRLFIYLQHETLSIISRQKKKCNRVLHIKHYASNEANRNASIFTRNILKLRQFGVFEQTCIARKKTPKHRTSETWSFLQVFLINKKPVHRRKSGKMKLKHKHCLMFTALCMKGEFSNDDLILAACQFSTIFHKWNSKSNKTKTYRLLKFSCLKYQRLFSLRHESEVELKCRELSICYCLKCCKLSSLAWSCRSKRAQLRSHSSFVPASSTKMSQTLSMLRVSKLARAAFV